MTLTFDLLTLGVSDELRAWHIQHTYQFLAPYGYPFLSYVWLNLITLPSPGTVTAHAPCHVTYHPGAKMITFLKYLTPIYLFTLSLSRSYDEDCSKLHVCYMRKIAFIPLWRLQSSLRMRSITWPVHRGSPKTTSNNFLTPTYLFTVQLLWGYDDD